MTAGRPHPATLPPKSSGGRPRKLTLFEQLLDQLQKRSERRGGGAPRDEGSVSIFSHLICGDGSGTQRAFKVEFEGEGATDAGGPYRELLSNLVEEAQSTALPLLIPTPNREQSLSQDRNKWAVNPSATSPRCMRLFELLGALMGLAMRTNHPMAFELPTFVWKLIVGDTPTMSDLAHVDLGTADLLQKIRHNTDPHLRDLDEESWDAAVAQSELFTFEYHRSDGVPVPLRPGGSTEFVTFATRAAWCDAVERLRRDECAEQVGAIRHGLGTVIPLDGLTLFSAHDVETMICGEADWTVAFLREHTELRLPAGDLRVKWLWEALESFEQAQRAQFLQFVWGRSRMPEKIDARMQLGNDDTSETRGGNPNLFLPTAHTCAFTLLLPRYTDAAILSERLLYAINHGRAIDLDHEADASAWVMAESDDEEDE